MLDAQRDAGRLEVALLFDLDGTLIDSVYQHVISWRQALEAIGVALPVWRIHRRIGMSGGLFVSALARETGIELTPEETAQVLAHHDMAFEAQRSSLRPLPGSKELLETLGSLNIPWAIATSGNRAAAQAALDLLGQPDAVAICREQVRYAKPDPDLFLHAAEQLGVDVRNCLVVGDSIWDMLAARRAGALGIGLLSGGYGRDELERAGAFRVYEEPRDLLAHLDELGIRRPT
jgi:HAD superfamily hydrolase (TIGR01549 family)